MVPQNGGAASTALEMPTAIVIAAKIFTFIVLINRKGWVAIFAKGYYYSANQIGYTSGLGVAIGIGSRGLLYR